MQAHARPRERQIGPALRRVSQPVVGGDMHRGIEQRGMHAEQRGVGTLSAG